MPSAHMIPAEEALQRATNDRQGSRWPSRADKECRLEPVVLPIIRPSFHFKRTDRIFTIGSCFARNIEEYLGRLGFSVPTLSFSVPTEEWPGRPSGILNKYTPVSMWQEVDRCARALRANSAGSVEDILYEPLLDLGPGKTIDLEVTGYNPVSPERAAERRKQIYDLYRQAFECEVIIITLGLIEAWFDNDKKQFIQQAPLPQYVKRFPGRFFFRKLAYEECRDYAARAIDVLREVGNKDKRFIITTSPVPLARTFTGQDIVVANNYAKSILRAVCGELSEQGKGVIDYFPSYEMATLSRQDGIWQDDLIHVTDQFVSRIVTHMMKAYVPDQVGSLDLAGRMWSAIFAKRYDEALAAYAEQEVAEKDDLVATLYGLALALGGEVERGRNLITENAHRARLTAEQAVRVGAFLYDHGDFAQCRAVIGSALRDTGASDEQRANLNARMALAVQAVGEHHEALNLMSTALECRRTINVLNMAGRLALLQTDWKTAEQYFGEVVRVLAPYPTKSLIRGYALGGLALAAVMKGDEGAARDYAEQAVWNHPKSRLAHEAKRKLMKREGSAQMKKTSLTIPFAQMFRSIGRANKTPRNRQRRRHKETE